MIPFVKICGLTRRKDVDLAVDLGANALGFIFYPASPRAVELKNAHALTARLPKNVLTTGVFVNSPLSEMAAVVGELGLRAVQLHGDETPNVCQALRESHPNLRLTKAFRVRRAEDLAAVRAYLPIVDQVLLDVPVGTHETLAPELLRPLEYPFILAGGLTVENLPKTMAEVRPAGVDVARGVEASPGRKDPAKMRAFFRALKEIA